MSRFLILIALLAPGIGCYTDEALAPAGAPVATRVFITDAPFPFASVAAVEVYVVEIAASTQSDTSAGADWVTLAEPRRRFELLSLQQGDTALLGAGDLVPAEYRGIRLTIRGDSSRVTFAAGHEANVRWPGTGDISLFPLVERAVTVSGELTRVVIDLDVGRSFISGLADPLHDFAFLPVLRAVDPLQTGDLAGRVFGDGNGDGVPEPVEHAAITVYTGTPGEPSYTWRIIATGHTRPDGSYRVSFLLAGTYLVQVDAPLSPALGSTTTAVEIAIGGVTTHSVTLPPLEGASLAIAGPGSVAVGDTITLRAVVRDGAGVSLQNPAVRWQSLNPAVATVTDIGEFATVRGSSVGVAPIVAEAAGVTDSIDVVVVPAGS